MQQYVVKRSQSEDLIDEYCEKYNLDNAHKFKRKNDKLSLKSGHTNLLIGMMKVLGAKLKKLHDNGMPVHTEDALTLNNFHSYYKKLSKGRLNVCKRTIRRYLDHLDSLGLILFRQVENRSMIMLHPDLIRFTDEFEVLISCSLCQFFAIEPGSLQKLQHPDILPLFLKRGVILSPKPITGNSNKKLQCKVENPPCEITAEGNPLAQENTAGGNPEPIGLEARKAAEKNGELQAPRPKNLQEYSERRRALNRAESRASMINRFVAILWSFALRKFYFTDWRIDPDTQLVIRQYDQFDESQEQIIFQYYKDQLEAVPDHRIKEVFEELNERNKRWLKFLKKDPEHKFTPLPGTFYNLNHTKGFYMTKAWVNRDKKKAETYKVRNQIDQQLRRAKKLLTGAETYNGRHLSGKERLYYVDQINASVDQIATRYDRPDLLLSYHNRLTEFIEKNSAQIVSI